MSRAGKTFCEFFAGIGLMRAGLEPGGWSCIYANDIDPKKEEMYKARFSSAEHFHLGDVWKTDDVLARLDGQPYLATASFPCIDLSLAGHWRGLDGEHSSTFFAFAAALKAMGTRKPRLVLLENVTGLLTSHHGHDFKTVVTTLADLGYWVDSFCLDARYFVPQSRPRVFIVGIHERLDVPVLLRRPQQFSLDDAWRIAVEASGALRPPTLVQLMLNTEVSTGWATLPLRPPPERAYKLDDFIGDDDGQWWDESAVQKHLRMMSDLHQSVVSELLSSNTRRVGTIFRRKRHGSTRAEVRFDGLAGCLRTPRGGSARQIVIVIDNGRVKMRWMTPREYARLQGAGDFPITTRVNQALFGFGDAVCVPVIEWVDLHVLSKLFEADAAHARETDACRQKV